MRFITAWEKEREIKVVPPEEFELELLSQMDNLAIEDDLWVYKAPQMNENSLNGSSSTFNYSST